MMPIMRKPLPTPKPPQLGERNGLAYALFLPEGEPSAGIVICHGAGSAKESHFDFGRAARGAGMAAVAFDARGHGRSDGEFGPSAFADVLEMVELMREHTPHVAIRGSSMGGFVALHAAAAGRGGRHLPGTRGAAGAQRARGTADRFPHGPRPAGTLAGDTRLPPRN